MSDWNKHVANRQEFRRLYESGKNIYQIAILFEASPETVRRGIHAAGGKTFRRARKYFQDSQRERQIKQAYGASVQDLESLKKKQKGMCLWCFAPLPEDVLKCTVDHIGGRTTHGDRSKVRGLCCSGGHCNRLAGMVERGLLDSNSLFYPFVRRVRQVVKLYTNGGPLV
jgi:Recombination endonuclease VII